jgi:hypothetical protein
MIYTINILSHVKLIFLKIVIYVSCAPTLKENFLTHEIHFKTYFYRYFMWDSDPKKVSKCLMSIELKMQA